MARKKLTDIFKQFDLFGKEIRFRTKANDEFGLDILPSVLYWKGEVPNMYPGDISDTKALLDWVVTTKSEDTIEFVTEEILEDMVDKFEFIPQFFKY